MRGEAIRGEYGNPTPPYQPGTWPDEVKESEEASFREARNWQGIRHFSQLIFSYVTEVLERKDDEFQTMHVNDRIVVAMNNSNSLNELFKDLEDKTLRDILKKAPLNDDRVERTGKKFLYRVKHPLIARKKRGEFHSVVRGLYRGARDDVVMTLNANNDGSCVDAITSPLHKGKIIFITLGSGHAEQRLLKVLVRSRQRGMLARIYGKKRPCRLCRESLTLARDLLGFRIEFNDHGGGYWTNPEEAFADIINLGIGAGYTTKEAADEWIAERAKSFEAYKTKLRTTGALSSGYDTDSDSD